MNVNILYYYETCAKLVGTNFNDISNLAYKSRIIKLLLLLLLLINMVKVTTRVSINILYYFTKYVLLPSTGTNNLEFPGISNQN